VKNVLIFRPFFILKFLLFSILTFTGTINTVATFSSKTAAKSVTVDLTDIHYEFTYDGIFSADTPFSQTFHVYPDLVKRAYLTFSTCLDNGVRVNINGTKVAEYFGADNHCPNAPDVDVTANVKANNTIVVDGTYLNHKKGGGYFFTLHVLY
jgi:hypothetical protein